VRSQHTGAVLFVREIGWRGTSTDKLIVDEFLDLEYKDTEEAPGINVLEEWIVVVRPQRR